MEILNSLNQKIKEAMINKNASELKTLRLIKSEITKSEKDGIELNDVTIFKILNKMLNQREDAYNQYIKAERHDLANVELEEMNVIKSFMPKQPSEEEINSEIKNTIENYISSKDETFKISMKDMKTILTTVQIKYPTVNGKIVSEVLKTYIN
jgi:uncharacterized protein YqeY